MISEQDARAINELAEGVEKRFGPLRRRAPEHCPECKGSNVKQYAGFVSKVCDDCGATWCPKVDNASVDERYREAARSLLRALAGAGATAVVESVSASAEVKILNQRERGGAGDGAFVTVEVWVPASEIAGQP